MGSLNIAEWTPEQVADWLTGLGPKVAQYVPELQRKALNGSKLLTMRCDDLEYLGVHIIGHQELILEAVEHLRNFHYERSRECVQQLAVRVSGAAASLARALRCHGDARLETASLADVARTVHAVKPLVCWLDRWALSAGSPLGARKAALLKLSLEAATCAQRERFAEQPARAVAAAAAALASLADYIIQDVSDPTILQPARVDAVCLSQGERALGFEVVPSFCGHHQLAHIRFASPAHASGLLREADEIVQVGARCVLGWPGDAVEDACRIAARGGDLPLRLRRRGARALPVAPRAPPPPPAARPPPPDDDDSDALSPPASPTLLPTLLLPDAARMYPPKPRACAVRRHSVSGASPAAAGQALAVHQLWQQLQQQRLAVADGDGSLYRRDKAVSCSTGLQLSPRPQTCVGTTLPLVQRGQLDGQIVNQIPGQLAGQQVGQQVGPPAGNLAGQPSTNSNTTSCRGKLDKSHSTPAYDFEPGSEAGSSTVQTIPESPTTPVADAPTPPHTEKAGQILDFKMSSSRIEEAIQQRRRANADDERNDIFTDEDAQPIDDDATLEIVETLNPEMRETTDNGGVRASLTKSPGRRGDGHLGAIEQTRPRPAERSPPAPPPRPGGARGARGARMARADREPIAKHDIRLVSAERRELPAINGEADRAERAERREDAARDAGGAPRALLPSSKARSLKKKSSLLLKRRAVPARLAAGGAGGVAGGAEQRVRSAGGATRWAVRQLVLAHGVLYAYRSARSARASAMIYLQGCTVCAAAEVRSRPYAFKVYHTGAAFYFACESREAMLSWIALVHRATLLPSLLPDAMDLSKQFSETDYSETESDSENSEKRTEKEKEREKEKSKFGSLKKLTHRASRSESQENVGQQTATSLDRKYLRFFSRARPKDDVKTAKKPSAEPLPTEHYRSYRRASPSAPRAAASAAAKLPKPINYIHASNPNLLDFEKSDFVTKPSIQVPKPKPPKPVSLTGLVTLEEFMLQKQAEERQQLYWGRATRLGDRHAHVGHAATHRYECMAAPDGRSGRTDATPSGHSAPLQAAADSVVSTSGVSRLRLMFGARKEVARQESSRSEQYPHLQCPPTFQPETYSLARPPRDAHTRTHSRD